MAENTNTSYQDSTVQWFQSYLEMSNEHQILVETLDNILPAEFKRIGDGKNSLDVLGVGSGGGQKDVHMLTLLQSTFPGVPISAEIIEGSEKLSNNFKALLAKTPNLSTVPFSWNMMLSEDYMKQAKGKKFDFIHMIQVIYYVKDLAETIKFYHGLLKKNGRLMIILLTENCSWGAVWKAFEKDLWDPSWMVDDMRTSEGVKAQLDKMGLKYEEHQIPHEFDISECFIPGSKVGRNLLNFFTGKDFYASFTPETTAAMLDVLKIKGCKQKEGKIMFNNDMRCILIHS